MTSITEQMAAIRRAKRELSRECEQISKRDDLSSTQREEIVQDIRNDMQALEDALETLRTTDQFKQALHGFLKA